MEMERTCLKSEKEERGTKTSQELKRGIPNKKGKELAAGEEKVELHMICTKP